MPTLPEPVPDPRPRGRGSGVRVPRRRVSSGLAGPVATIVVAAVVALVGLAQVWTRLLWFESVDAKLVFTRTTSAQAGLFLVTALVAGGLVASSLVVAHRTRPLLVPLTPAELDLERRRAALEPLRRLVGVLAPAVVGVVAGLAAASRWPLLVLWWHRRSFGVAEPTFDRDVGFFVVDLPWWSLVVDLSLVAVAAAACTAAAAHLVHGGLRVGPGARSSRAAVVHVSVLLALLLALQAVRYLLDRYAVAVGGSGASLSGLPGVTYTGEHATMPGKAVLAAAAAVCAVLCLSAVRTGTWRLPAVGVVSLAVCALVLGTVYPGVVEWSRVGDQRAALERPYAAQALAATRRAFGLDAVERLVVPAATAAPARARTEASSLAGVPVLDPRVVQPAADAAAARRPGGRASAVEPVVTASGSSVLAAVSAPPAGGGDWTQRHLVRTHGSGLLTAPATAAGADGAITFRPDPGVRHPQVYFAPGVTDYVVVGGDGAAREDDGGAVRSRYEGTAGVSLSDAARRVAFAVAERDPRLAVSQDVAPGARVVDVRDPAERVRAVAPWLTVDSHPYPVTVDGRIVWVVDGYTSSSSYPGSIAVDLDAALGSPREPLSGPHRSTRYLRDAVKATVDAYDGTVRLYAWDGTDPLLASWSAAFPGLVRPASDLPAALRPQLRYPHDLFLVQQAVLARVHDDDPGRLLDASSWSVPSAQPTRPTASSSATPRATSGSGAAPATTGPLGAAADRGRTPAGPAFVPARLVGGATVGAAATGALVDAQGSRTTAVLLAGVDPARPRRAVLRLVDLPAAASVPTPDAAAQAASSSGATSRAGSTRLSAVVAAATTTDRAGSGAVVVVPFAGGGVTVQPVVAARGLTGARLGAVVVTYAGRLAWGPSLDAALADLADGGGEALPAVGVSGGTTSSPGSEPTASPDAVEAARAEAARAVDDLAAAARSHDRTAYEQADRRLRTAQARLADLLSTASPTGSGSPATSASPHPSTTADLPSTATAP